MAMISIITVEVVTGFLHVHKLFIATTQHTKDITLCFIRYCKKLCLLDWSSLQMSGLSVEKQTCFCAKPFSLFLYQTVARKINCLDIVI
jgi:hypothetical protein